MGVIDPPGQGNGGGRQAGSPEAEGQEYGRAAVEDTRTPDAIIPAAQREGFTERPPPRPALVAPDQGAEPGVIIRARRLLPRSFLHIAGLAVAHGVCLPVVCIIGLNTPPGGEWVVECLGWAFCFPDLILYAFAAPFLPADMPLYPLNSLLWVATVYGLFLAGRWAYPRLRPPALPARPAGHHGPRTP